MDSFFDSAIRHWVDGGILEEHGEYDNAVGLQGFAAECALKAIFRKGLSNQVDADEIVKKYSHLGEILIQDIEMMLLNDTELTAIIDPGYGIRLADIFVPTVLFDCHPERRYFQDGVYSEEDAKECRMCAEACVKEMIRLYVDGYLG